jgi:hypothetical protein
VRRAVLISVLAAGLAPAASNPIEALNQRLRAGEVQLQFEPVSGYLRSVLGALRIPVQSQVMVFSKTSLMKELIGPRNPRAIYFNDTVTAAWVRGEPFVEIATADAAEGIAFYTLAQLPGKPRFDRGQGCRTCHETFSTVPLPRLMVRSVFPGADGTPVRTLGEFETTDRSPLRERWGGWYVTGRGGSSPHLGNTVYSDGGEGAAKASYLESLAGRFDSNGYLTPYSDAAALLVFEHQMGLLNLFARVAADIRKTDNPAALIPEASRQIADALLFKGAAPIQGVGAGASGFAEWFAAQGPLRQLDLRGRLLRDGCSYMIYSEAFDALPDNAKSAIYARLWEVLSGKDPDKIYQRLSPADRDAIIEILRDTKPNLPDYFYPAPSGS